MYQERKYRDSLKQTDLVNFTVTVYESDLWICISRQVLDNYKLDEFKKITENIVTKYRQDIENYIKHDPGFKTAFAPYDILQGSPLIVQDMTSSSTKANVGPMASVAGAIAEYTGKDLLEYSKEVIVENGGDIFLATEKKRKIGIYTTNPKFSDKVAIEISPENTPIGICTSSGTLGHSVSLGTADAVVAVSYSTSLADACATAIGNIIKTPSDIDEGIDFARRVEGMSGVIIIKDDQLGVWGNITLVKP